MSKVKHFLRKLHIGDHHHHGRPPSALDPSPGTGSPPPQPMAAASSPSTTDLPQAVVSTESGDSSGSNFIYFEEEFQMQLALAISVSDPGQTLVDPETAQINVAKQISLGCSPSQSLSEFMSLRYWSCNVINYDEKVIDGFYDVCGDSNLVVQTKMPSLAELERTCALDHIGREVVLVNRAVDVELRKLEEKVHFMTMECHALDRNLNTNLLVQKIARLIVERMGGPVTDVEDMFRRWRARNHDLRIYLSTIILPIGSLDIGHSRQRALLFKVLADRINLPCKLVKGSYYTGTDEGAVNLIKLDDGSEYIVDLMGAPGTLIPTEPPSSLPLNFGLGARNIATFAGNDCKLGTTASNGKGDINFVTPCVDRTPKSVCSSSESSAIAMESIIKGRKISQKLQTKQLEHGPRDLYIPPRVCEESLHAGNNKLSGLVSGPDDPSCFASNAARKAEFYGEIPTIYTEERAPKPKKLFLDMNTNDFREGKVPERNELMWRGSVVDECHAEINLTTNEHSLVPYTGWQLFNLSCNSSGEQTAAGLGAQLFKQESEGNNMDLNIPGEQNMLVSDRNNGMLTDNDTANGRGLVDFSGSTEVMLVSGTDQSNANMIHDMQIDPVLNGVAEILWEDLQIGERIGIGKSSAIDLSLLIWFLSRCEVAVKKFMNQDISADALAQFKCEVEIMLRLRHPNVVLFMGAVTRPPNLSILTEFLPRGSLYKLLHRPNIQIDEKRRIKMALDVVCDFGMSRFQYHTFLSSKSIAGTAEWMAPEVLRNEPSNEKSDVYSFGVILWELATLLVPWTGMNSMQVVGAVGFQGRHLEIPPTVDPLVAAIINDCWSRNPQERPSFAQIITRLKGLQRLTVKL
ncbi:kinase family protein [Striga asiatica]|uniref:Kinase family protein n=1 Tax=Striga asiatica TaxID=4170 RepID=A0A5A7PHN5_STRAF|nr:kinase family protein [Striga asiatica]